MQLISYQPFLLTQQPLTNLQISVTAFGSTLFVVVHWIGKGERDLPFASNCSADDATYKLLSTHSLQSIKPAKSLHQLQAI